MRLRFFDISDDLVSHVTFHWIDSKGLLNYLLAVESESTFRGVSALPVRKILEALSTYRDGISIECQELFSTLFYARPSLMQQTYRADSDLIKRITGNLYHCATLPCSSLKHRWRAFSFINFLQNQAINSDAEWVNASIEQNFYQPKISQNISSIVSDNFFETHPDIFLHLQAKIAQKKYSFVLKYIQKLSKHSLFKTNFLKSNFLNSIVTLLANEKGIVISKIMEIIEVLIPSMTEEVIVNSELMDELMPFLDLNLGPGHLVSNMFAQLVPLLSREKRLNLFYDISDNVTDDEDIGVRWNEALKAIAEAVSVADVKDLFWHAWEKLQKIEMLKSDDYVRDDNHYGRIRLQRIQILFVLVPYLRSSIIEEYILDEYWLTLLVADDDWASRDVGLAGAEAMRYHFTPDFFAKNGLFDRLWNIVDDENIDDVYDRAQALSILVLCAEFYAIECPEQFAKVLNRVIDYCFNEDQLDFGITLIINLSVALTYKKFGSEDVVFNVVKQHKLFDHLVNLLSRATFEIQIEVLNALQSWVYLDYSHLNNMMKKNDVLIDIIMSIAIVPSERVENKRVALDMLTAWIAQGLDLRVYLEKYAAQSNTDIWKILHNIQEAYILGTTPMRSNSFGMK